MLFTFYKRGQGMLVRSGFLVGLLVVLLFGCRVLAEQILLKVGGFWRKILFSLPIEGFDVEIRHALAAGLFALGGLGIYLLLNRPRAADFLIDTEGELKKVTWATGQEVRGATAVVIAMILFLSLILFVLDWVLLSLVNGLMGLAGGGPV